LSRRDAQPGTGEAQSGCGLQGDLEAEGFELADVVACLAVRADAVVVEVGAQVVVAGLRIRQQVPDDDQDRAADRDDGLFLALLLFPWVVSGGALRSLRGRFSQVTAPAAG
jgi:hypothetical protein